MHSVHDMRNSPVSKAKIIAFAQAVHKVGSKQFGCFPWLWDLCFLWYLFASSIIIFFSKPAVLILSNLNGKLLAVTVKFVALEDQTAI